MLNLSLHSLRRLGRFLICLLLVSATLALSGWRWNPTASAVQVQTVSSSTSTSASFVSPEELAKLKARNSWIEQLSGGTATVDGKVVQADPD